MMALWRDWRAIYRGSWQSHKHQAIVNECNDKRQENKQKHNLLQLNIIVLKKTPITQAKKTQFAIILQKRPFNSRRLSKSFGGLHLTRWDLFHILAPPKVFVGTMSKHAGTSSLPKIGQDRKGQAELKNSQLYMFLGSQLDTLQFEYWWSYLNCTQSRLRRMKASPPLLRKGQIVPTGPPSWGLGRADNYL